MYLCFFVFQERFPPFFNMQHPRVFQANHIPKVKVVYHTIVSVVFAVPGYLLCLGMAKRGGVHGYMPDGCLLELQHPAKHTLETFFLSCSCPLIHGT